MIKSLKICFIIVMLIILLSFTTNVLAVDTNINATSSEDLLSNTTSTTNTSDTSNSTNTTNATNSTNSTNSSNVSNSTNSTNTTANTTASSTSSANTNSITVQGGLPESDLGISNILSIILIAIGVLLILLAIAILIRLGK